MPLYETNELFKWIWSRNANIHISIIKTTLGQCYPWYYDRTSGTICNPSHTFFQIAGMQVLSSDHSPLEQPIIIQNEIGYLGILCRKFDGEMHYLMQAKIEPGNINKIQLSPTIQATKSNFTRKHGGAQPAYLDYFIHASNYHIIFDQIQSEQSSRFLGKRNRNIILELDESEEIDVLPSHRWMTLPQIKALMRYDNLVNMDTRTVLSGLPLYLPEYRSQISNEAFYRSVTEPQPILPELYQYINNYKMFHEEKSRLIPLHELKDWEMKDDEIVCKHPYSFRVIFCDIEIEGREVRHWCQPLFEAAGIATFGLLTRIQDGVQQFLIQALPEIGCFDRIEFGPSVQRESVPHQPSHTVVDAVFDSHLKNRQGILFDTLLSEEGGRFYHEQNRNVIVEVDSEEIPELPPGYFWVNYRTLNQLVEINNCLNIQLRNLLSVLEW